MTNIETDKVECQQSAEKIFTFLSDFNNFHALMPPQVTNWTSTSETCSFTINNMATVGMRVLSKEPFSKIHITSDGGKVPFSFTLDVVLVSTGENTCTGQLVFAGDIPMFIRPMVVGPLTNFFNLLARKMTEIK